MSVEPGKVIREMRIERGWTNAELARRSKMSPGQLSKLEKGQSNLRVPAIFKLAKALNLKPCLFFMTASDREAFESVADLRW